MILYRYIAAYPTEFQPAGLVLEKNEVIKETPKGYWIGPAWKKRWISNYNRARFAYPTKEEAMVHFTKRTTRRIEFLKIQIKTCEDAMAAAKLMNLNK